MNNICYNGIGSIQNKNHTKKQFLDIMDKNFKEKCSNNIKSLRCKSCQKIIKMNDKVIRKSIKYKKKNKTYIMPKKLENKIVKLTNKCNKCKKLNNKNCTFKQYLKYSGAYLGNC
jgi:hypothetical protein